ncbi:putative transposase [Sphingobacterium sp. BIGb0165]|nr:putative transposase [Sphingobacterium sp. BIGb0165]
MKRSKFTEAQIAFALRQSETQVEEICRQMDFPQATFFNWKKKYGGLGVPELHKLRQLEEENAQDNSPFFTFGGMKVPLSRRL